MAANIPQAVQSCHELLLWLIPQLDTVPRVRRFTLGDRIEVSELWARKSVRPELVEG
jgi:hypothetical protein